MDQIQQVPHGFTGTISLRLADLIQMICLARSDLVIKVNSKSGKGAINIQKGRIHHAQTDHLLGETAFFEMLGWNDGQFEVLPIDDYKGDSIDKPWEHLLLEAIRQQDESGGISEELDPPHSESKSIDIEDLFDNLDSGPAPDTSRVPAGREEGTAEPAHRTIKVLIVDDSRFFTKKLQEMLETDPAIEVVGIARNGEEMLEVLDSGTPVDLITLDIEMPVMPGETSIKHIMIRHRLPVLIITSLQPNSMDKVMDFLQLGAVDVLTKPGAHDDHLAYTQNLCELIKGASTARLSHFRRLRKSKDHSRLQTEDSNPRGNNLIVIIGAEGAHIEWFRLPLRQLSERGLLIGLQKLPENALSAFAKLIQERVGVRTLQLLPAHRISQGSLCLSNPAMDAIFSLSSGNSALEMKITGSMNLKWRIALESWLLHLAEQARDSMRICLLSAVDTLSETTLDRLFGFDVRLILPPPQSVMCSQLVDSVRPYAHIFPDQVLTCELNSLVEYV